ncbi:MAG: ankyrin repeat domain-containing protein [Rhodospirillales bacterium]|nr:ankyrin repeat domain-containing protein [Rhodospirillales bacterium]
MSIGALVLCLGRLAGAQAPSTATDKLFEAVYNGDLAQVQISIAGGGDINAVNGWGITPVDLAVDRGHFDIVHFLLQVRDQKSQKKKPTPAPVPVTSLATNGNAPTAPAPVAAPVAEVYAPPPDAGPWSATVVTSEPPPPPPVIAAGPSPFDQEATADATLPIIGTIRGPTASAPLINTNIQTAVQETFQKVVKQPKPLVAPTPAPAVQKVETKPEPAAEIAAIKVAPEVPAPVVTKEPGIWDDIKSLLTFDDAEKAETSTPPKPASEEPTPMPAPIAKTTVEQTPPPTPPDAKPTPVMEVRKSASLALTTAPVSPPNVTGPPPAINTKVLPEAVTQAPLTNLSSDDLETPQVVPVQTSPPAATALKEDEKPKQPTKNTNLAKVTRIAKPESPASKLPAQEPSSQQAVQVGTTTMPGKPKDQESFFTKVMSIFSSDDDDKKTDKELSVASETPTPESRDWTVKNIQQAQIVPRKPVKKVVRILPENRLEGVILSLGSTTALGKTPPPQAPAPWYYKSCINKKLGSTVFCIEPLDWPTDIHPYFLTDSILYEGTQSIVRYDEGAATYFHVLFPSQSYDSIIEFFSRRYGPPTQKLKRSIAPLAEPRRINPTVIWQSIAPVTNLLTTLEIRQFDDNRGGFPDTRRGAVYLYHEWSQPVFPQLSSIELMLLRAEAKQR